MTYSTIAVIFNPISTGSSEKLANDFAEAVRARLPDQSVQVIPTEYAGHAEQIAYDLAHDHDTPLIISSSGDGGYNEVVNGAMRAQAAGFHPTTSLLPAGNANDHHRNLASGDLVELIANGTPRDIDILTITATVDGRKFRRYAHSYIGLGLTPDVGNELNKRRINIFNEAWTVLSALFAVRPIRLTIGSKTRTYDSIIFSNIDSMSKVLKVSNPSSVTDGLFEVTIFRKRNKFKLIATLLQASLGNIKHDQRVREFTLQTVNKTSVQADGEVWLLDAHCKVTVSIEKQQLHCLL